uniref:Uncharacterized protein n=1 Tax=Tanacetum cinerariifolium TaxID=118510 RepID=A0A6L2K568_TANCI|nr:hypothetical protein [Tanacetum cinerariifolium]
MDYKQTKAYLPRIHRLRQMDEDLRESYYHLEGLLFHEGRFVTLSFIEANNMLPSFCAIGLEPFLSLNEPICPRFVVKFYHSLEVKRGEEDHPYIEFNLGQFTFYHILQTNPQAIVPLDRFTFYKCIMNPLDISRNPTKDKGKRVAFPSACSSSSSSSGDSEAPSFLEFYKELPNN